MNQSAMEKQILNDELEFAVPEGFSMLSSEECRELNFYDGEGLCLSDPERHVLISLGSMKLSGFANILLSEKDLIRNAENRISMPMQEFGYEQAGSVKAMIAGREAPGFSYDYQVKDIRMHGESYLLKKDRTVYYFNLYVRDETKEEGLKAAREFLSLITLKS